MQAAAFSHAPLLHTILVFIFLHNTLLCNSFGFLLPHTFLYIQCALKICCPCFSLRISLHAALHMKKNITFFFYCCVRNFIAFSATGHLRSAAFCLLIFFSLLCIFIPNTKHFICCALHSFCCEYVLSHYIEGNYLPLLCISMHVHHKKIPNCCFMFCLPTAVRVFLLCILFFLRCCSLHLSAAPISFLLLWQI